MNVPKDYIKTSYSDEFGHHVYTILKGYGRVILEKKIDKIHITLRQKIWVDILNRVIDGEVTDKMEVYKPTDVSLVG